MLRDENVTLHTTLGCVMGETIWRRIRGKGHEEREQLSMQASCSGVNRCARRDPAAATNTTADYVTCPAAVATQETIIEIINITVQLADPPGFAIEK